MRQLISFLFLLSLAACGISVTASAFPLGLGYDYTTEDVEIPENAVEKEAGSFKFHAAYHTLSLLDYSGLLCAGFQNVHAQSEAHNKAQRDAKYDSTKKAGDKITYSWKAVSPVQGTACGLRMHLSASDEKADIGGSLPNGKSSGPAEVGGWSAFGVVAMPVIDDKTVFKFNLAVDVRSFTVKGIPTGPFAMAGDDVYENDFIAMPMDLQLDRIINVAGVGGFLVYGSIGHDPMFWLLKQLAPSKIPSDFWRFGFGAGYQTPIEGLQIRAGYKNTDSGFDSRQVKESGYTLGTYYQM